MNNKNKFFVYLVILFIFFLSTDFVSAAEVSEKHHERLRYYDNGKVREKDLLDSQGNLIEKVYYGEDGSPQQFRKFDSLGNLLEECFLNPDGSLAINPLESWSAMRWTYKDNRLVSDSSYDDRGHLIEKRFYNSSGDLIKREYVGGADPDEEYTPPLALQGRTDEFFDQD